MGDLIRVIGTYNQENEFSLQLDDQVEAFSKDPKNFGMGPKVNGKANMIIVEPYILIPVTQIVSSFPCVRKAILQKQYNGLSSDINYALVLGNIVH